jgi:hypothetical protein
MKRPILLLTTLGRLLTSGAALARKKIIVGHTAVPDFAAAFIAKERRSADLLAGVALQGATGFGSNALLGLACCRALRWQQA